MNKKILSLAFISAAFIFGCSADGAFTSSNTPPEWEHKPDDLGTPSNTPSTPGGNSNGYCSFSYLGQTVCEELDSSYTEADCRSDSGTVVSSTNNCDYVY